MSIAIEALDALAVELSEHGHVWADRERRLYEEATSPRASHKVTGLLVSEIRLTDEPLCTRHSLSGPA